MFNRHKSLKVTLLASILLTFLFPAYTSFIYRNPVDLPISLSPPSGIDEPFFVPQENTYILSLAFEREGVSVDTLEELLGKSGLYFKREQFSDDKVKSVIGNGYYQKYEAGQFVQVRTGTPVSVQWAIYSLPDKTVMYQGIEETAGLDEWEEKYVIRYISSFISEFPDPVGKIRHHGFGLKAGQYELTATVKKDVPNLSKLKARVLLHPCPTKDTLVFQQLVWFGLVLLDMTLAAILAVMLWRSRKIKDT